MPAFVPPRLEVVADGDRLHAVRFGRDRDLDQLARVELLSGCLVAEFQVHPFNLG